jgi:hypothetical protein
VEAARARLTQAGLPSANPVVSVEGARHTAPAGVEMEFAWIGVYSTRARR